LPCFFPVAFERRHIRDSDSDDGDTRQLGDFINHSQAPDLIFVLELYDAWTNLKAPPEGHKQDQSYISPYLPTSDDDVDVDGVDGVNDEDDEGSDYYEGFPF